MENDELFYYLALQSVVGIGPINAKKLLRHYGGARQVFAQNKTELSRIRGLSTTVLKELTNPMVFKKAEKEIRFIEARGISAVTIDQEAFPAKLLECQDAPIVLFSKGNFDLTNKKIISIVGTRMMTPYGRQFLTEFIKEIKQFDPVIVSGLAYGVDVCAHQEAIKNNICTIGILAHGLDRIYPKTHGTIAERMLQNGGLFTEFWSGSSPERENFVKRNRIIAGLSVATLVVESASKGGSLITADLAHSYNRDVFAVAGRNNDTFSKGCNMLIKSNKAAMITSVKDLEYVLGWRPSSVKNEKAQLTLFDELKEEEKMIYEVIRRTEKIMLDQLVQETGYRIQKALTILLQLELKGIVRSLPGKFYQLI